MTDNLQTSETDTAHPPRRTFLRGVLATGGLAVLPACTSFGGFGLTDAVQRLLFLSSERAFARMLQADGFWDSQVAQLGLADLLGSRGRVLDRILTSSLFKSRLETAFGNVAYEGAERAAPLVTDAVRVIGIQNAIDLVNGGPRAATTFLRGSMGTTLVEAMVPELGQGLRLAREPLVGEFLSALTGLDLDRSIERFATNIDNTIWREIGNEEATIRRDPRSTNDPLIIGVFGSQAAP